MRLNRWQRIAIVLSVVWAVGSGAYEWSASTTRAHSRALAEYESCIEIDALTHHLAFNQCTERASRVLAVELKGLWRNVAVVVLIPLAVVWIVAYIFLAVGRTAKRV